MLFGVYSIDSNAIDHHRFVVASCLSFQGESPKPLGINSNANPKIQSCAPTTGGFMFLLIPNGINNETGIP
jgi:hypothetical protein